MTNKTPFEAPKDWDSAHGGGTTGLNVVIGMIACMLFGFGMGAFLVHSQKAPPKLGPLNVQDVQSVLEHLNASGFDDADVEMSIGRNQPISIRVRQKDDWSTYIIGEGITLRAALDNLHQKGIDLAKATEAKP